MHITTALVAFAGLAAALPFHDQLIPTTAAALPTVQLAKNDMPVPTRRIERPDDHEEATGLPPTVRPAKNDMRQPTLKKMGRPLDLGADEFRTAQLTGRDMPPPPTEMPFDDDDDFQAPPTPILHPRPTARPVYSVVPNEPDNNSLPQPIGPPLAPGPYARPPLLPPNDLFTSFFPAPVVVKTEIETVTETAVASAGSPTFVLTSIDTTSVATVSPIKSHTISKIPPDNWTAAHHTLKHHRKPTATPTPRFITRADKGAGYNKTAATATATDNMPLFQSAHVFVTPTIGPSATIVDANYLFTHTIMEEAVKTPAFVESALSLEAAKTAEPSPGLIERARMTAVFEDAHVFVTPTFGPSATIVDADYLATLTVTDGEAEITPEALTRRAEEAGPSSVVKRSWREGV